MSISYKLEQSNKPCNKSIKIIAKANKIHLELLSFVQNEINEKKKNKQNVFSFLAQTNYENKKEDVYNKIIENKINNNEQNSNDTSFNSDDNEEESSSDMSCIEEYIIDI